MKILKTLLFGLLLIVVITFSMKNGGNVEIGYFNVIDAFEIPLFLVILLSILFGILIGTMADLMKRNELKKAIRRQQKVMDGLQKEVRSLRDLTLGGPKETGKEG